MAVSAYRNQQVLDPGSDAKQSLRDEWLSLGRVPADFDRLWAFYWSEQGRLAPAPRTVHELDEVLAR